MASLWSMASVPEYRRVIIVFCNISSLHNAQCTMRVDYFGMYGLQGSALIVFGVL